MRFQNSKPSIVAAWVTLTFVLTLMPLFIGEYYLHFTKLCMFYGLAAMGLNLVMGYTGQFSLAQASFMGIGAYVTAYMSVTFRIPAVLVFFMSGLSAAIFGAFLGLPTLRLRQGYLSVVTIAFAQAIHLVFVNWVNVTGGPSGFRGIPPFQFLTVSFESAVSQYYLIGLCVIMSIFLMMRIVESHIGRALKAIRENETAASVMGINTLYYKVLSFTIGSFISGIGGSLYAYGIRFISPECFNYGESIVILSMVIMGGIGTISGAILGATTLILLPEWLRVLGDFRLVVYALSVILMTLFCPTGLVGILRNIGVTIYKTFAGRVQVGASYPDNRTDHQEVRS